MWIKDEINNKINLINAIKVNSEFLLDASITQFDKDFKILRIIKSNKIDISTNNWVIDKPKIIKDNTTTYVNQLILVSNFDLKKINSLFSNLYSLNFIDLINFGKYLTTFS